MQTMTIKNFHFFLNTSYPLMILLKFVFKISKLTQNIY